MLWLLPLTLKFPKSQRFLLAERLSGMALEFYDLILAAIMQPQRQGELLDEAGRMLTKIRLYIRLSYDLHCMSLGQFAHAGSEPGGRNLGVVQIIKKQPLQISTRHARVGGNPLLS